MAVIRKFDPGFSRRKFLEKSARGIFGAGVLCSAWDAFARTGATNSAYPDEISSIEIFTKGRLSPGDLIDKDNVDLVADLLDPIVIQQIRTMGRKLKLASTTSELNKLCPVAYLEATQKNVGKAIFDSKGNVVTRDGKPWVGGNPFPEPKSPEEVFAAHTLSWGRHDSNLYAIKEYDLDVYGEIQYQYSTVWAEMATVARISQNPRPYLNGLEDKLRLQAVYFTEPGDVRGNGYLNIWPYDQSQFPELYGYIPAFKRVRRFPTNQRFEPLVPGSELYLSDAWAAGDPFLTWGGYTVVQRGPCLAAVSNGWTSNHSNWEHRVHGGPKNNMFWDTVVELVPESIVIEAIPVSFPRSPVSKKRVCFDARTLLPLKMISYDRRGKPFRYFDGSFSLFEDKYDRVTDGANTYWSWSTIHAFNVQTSRMSRIEQVKSVAGGHVMLVNDSSIYSRYLTTDALQRLGN